VRADLPKGVVNVRSASEEFVLGAKGRVIREDEKIPYVPEGEAAAPEDPTRTAKLSSGAPDIVGVTVMKVSHWFDQCESKRFDR
jgi:hypothetical protein